MGLWKSLLEGLLGSGKSKPMLTYEVVVRAEYLCTLAVCARDKQEIQDRLHDEFASSLEKRLGPGCPFDDIAAELDYNEMTFKRIDPQVDSAGRVIE